MTAKCKLCWLKPAIRNSHVLSKLAYSRYVADDERSGSCIKLDTLREDSRQLTRQWFCKVCEKLFGEDYAAKFLDRVKVDRTDCQYREDLLRFVVSCSLRTCYYQLEHELNFAARRRLGLALKSWRDFLLKKTDDTEPYTQHAFVIGDETIWDERLGMHVSYPHNLVFTQVGPLLCFGVFGTTPPEDRLALKGCMVRKSGGVLPNLLRHSLNPELTDAMRSIIEYADEHCNSRVIEFSKTRNRSPMVWSEYIRMRNAKSRPASSMG
jgi:hypothetical protein